MNPGNLLPVLIFLLFANYFAPVGALMGFGPGPSGNATLFSDSNKYPNATGSVSLPALDTNLNNLQVRPVSWTAAVNVTEVPWTTNQTVTNSVISLSAPPRYFPKRKTVWETCLMIILDVEKNATVKGQKDTGDCHATFGEDCVGNLTRALQSAMADAAVRNGTGTCGGLTLPRVPTECQGSLTLDSFTSIITPNETMGGPYFYSASSPHDVSNTTNYEIAATRIWPLVLIQSSVRGGGGGGATRGKMSCLRAANATTGSKAIGDVPGTGTKLQNSWVLFGFLIVMSLVF